MSKVCDLGYYWLLILLLKTILVWVFFDGVLILVMHMNLGMEHLLLAFLVWSGLLSEAYALAYCLLLGCLLL